MSSPKEPKPDYEYMEEQLKLWETDINKWYENEMSSETARLAASGIEEGSDLWEKSMAAVESKYQERLMELQGSSTFKMVTGWKETRRRILRSDAMRISEAGRSGKLSAEDIRSLSPEQLIEQLGERTAVVPQTVNMGFKPKIPSTRLIFTGSSGGYF